MTTKRETGKAVITRLKADPTGNEIISIMAPQQLYAIERLIDIHPEVAAPLEQCINDKDYGQLNDICSHALADQEQSHRDSIIREFLEPSKNPR